MGGVLQEQLEKVAILRDICPSKKVINGKEKIYRYSGLYEQYGGKIVSKSALILPFDKGMEFAEELKQLNVPYTVFKIWM